MKYFNNLNNQKISANNNNAKPKIFAEDIIMKATGIVRRIDDLGRVVIPKEIRRTMRIREGDPSQTTLTQEYAFYNAMRDIAERLHIKV